MILDEAYSIISRRFKRDVEVKEYSVLERYLLLELSNGVCGVAYYPYDIAPKKPSIEAKDPLKLAKLSMSRAPGRRALGVAALNALTWSIKPEPEYKVGDPLDKVDFTGRRVALVGYFKPLLWRLKEARSVKIIERKEIEGVYPPEKAPEVLGEADIALITGSCLVYGGMERYLRLARNASGVIVLGPTSSMTPEPFFRRGAHIVAGVKIAGCGNHTSGRANDILSIGTKVYFERG